MSLIGIKLDGDDEYLDVNDDTTIEITLENPLLGDEQKLSPGSYTAPFDTPGGDASPGNSTKLKNPDVLENNESYQLQKASLFFDDLPFKRGTLKAKSTNGKKIESTFAFGLKAVTETMKSAKLRDVINEIIVIDDTACPRIIYVEFDQSLPLTFTVNGVSYDHVPGDPAGTLFTKMAIDVAPEVNSGKYIPVFDIDFTFVDPDPNKIRVKFVMATVNDTFTGEFGEGGLGYYYVQSTDPLIELSVDIRGDSPYVITTSDMSAYWNGITTFFAGYFSGAYPTDKFRLPFILNDNLYDGQAARRGNKINFKGPLGIAINYVEDENGVNQNSLQPFLMLKWVLEKIAETFGFVLEGDAYSEEDLTTRLVDNSQTLDLLQDYVGSNKLAFWRRSFNLNELVPDQTVLQFLINLSGRYNLGVYYDDITDKVKFVFREPFAKAIAYDDITRISSRVDDGQDQQVSGYTLKIPKEDTDELSVDETFVIGIPEDEIKISCGRIQNSKLTNVNAAFLLTPRVKRKNGAKFGLRIFHYAGIYVSGITGVSFPIARLSNSYSEELEDLHDRFHRYWLLFQKNRRLVKLRVEWPFRKLRQFDWTLKRRFDRSNYLVKTIKVKLTSRGVTVSDVDLITMK
jgi:hypothetical protein